MFKEVCPTVYDLLDKIVNHPIKQGEIAPSFAFVYDNFLSDLKVSLLSEDGSVELVDKIGHVKKENKIPVFVPGREDEILENLTRKIDSKYSMYIKDTFAHLLDVSKQYQVESVG